MSEDVLEKELSELESGDYNQADPNVPKKSTVEAKPKKNYIGAGAVIVGILGFAIFNYVNNGPSQSQNIETANLSDQSSVVEAPQETQFLTVSESDSVLEDLLSGGSDQIETNPEADDLISPSWDDSINLSDNWVDVDNLNPGYGWNASTGINSSELQSALTSYVPKEVYESAIASYRDRIEIQELRTEELLSSVAALSGALAKYEKLMESVELDIMINKVRPEIIDLIVIQPRFDCDDCISKASFNWEGIDTTVSSNSIFMGYKVVIAGDILKFVSGTVEHVYSPDS
jgi:hypothetical protein